METTLLLKVPACGSAPGRAGSNSSITSARPPKAPNEAPPPMYFPSVVTSGQIPSRACRPPGPVREVITSSKMSRAPDCRVASRSTDRNAGSPGMHPPEPSMGSTSTHARLPACSRSRACAPAASLYSASSTS